MAICCRVLLSTDKVLWVYCIMLLATCGIILFPVWLNMRQLYRGFVYLYSFSYLTHGSWLREAIKKNYETLDIVHGSEDTPKPCKRPNHKNIHDVWLVF